MGDESNRADLSDDYVDDDSIPEQLERIENDVAEIKEGLIALAKLANRFMLIACALIVAYWILR